MEKSPDCQNSVANALRILDYVGSSGASWYTLSEIQKATGLSRSTTFRNLQVLTRFAFLEKDSKSSAYRIGPKVIDIASSRINMLELKTESLPVLLVLQARVHATITLYCLSETDVLSVSLIRQSTVVQAESYAYQRSPAYCSSAGRCLLSSLSGSEINHLYANYTFRKFTDRTISNLEDLKKRLLLIRQRGYEVNLGEKETYTSSVSVPVYGYNGNVIAAIGLGLAPGELTEESLHGQYLPELKVAAATISRKMGFSMS